MGTWRRGRSAEAAAPEAKTETQTAPVKAEEKPTEAKTPNFDGFSDAQKKTWEREFKAGHVTAEEVETARIESMFQSAFTKKTMTLAEKSKALDALMEQHREDLALLGKIRADDKLHSAWLKMSKGEIPEDVGDDLVDAKKAAEIADRRLDAREAEKAARTAKEQAQYDARRDGIFAAVQEQIKLLNVPPATMKSYLDGIEAELPPGTDPITHFSPESLAREVGIAHRIAVAEAKAAAAEAALSQKTSTENRTAKQSLPPARRVTTNGEVSPLEQTRLDLGIAPDWRNVQGWGNLDAR